MCIAFYWKNKQLNLVLHAYIFTGGNKLAFTRHCRTRVSDFLFSNTTLTPFIDYTGPLLFQHYHDFFSRDKKMKSLKTCPTPKAYKSFHNTKPMQLATHKHPRRALYCSLVTHREWSSPDRHQPDIFIAEGSVIYPHHLS